jgi:hypothetical protein
MLLVAPLIIGNGILLPLYACRVFEVSLLDYLHKVFLVPLLCCAAFTLVLEGSRYIFSGNLLLGLLVGSLMGAIVQIVLYWKYLLTDNVKSKIQKKFNGIFSQ